MYTQNHDQRNQATGNAPVSLFTEDALAEFESINDVFWNQDAVSTESCTDDSDERALHYINMRERDAIFNTVPYYDVIPGTMEDIVTRLEFADQQHVEGIIEEVAAYIARGRAGRCHTELSLNASLRLEKMKAMDELFLSSPNDLMDYLTEDKVAYLNSIL